MTRHSMPCPRCSHTFLVEAAHDGRRARCGRCDHAFVISLRAVPSTDAQVADELARRVRETGAALEALQRDLALAREQRRAAREEARIAQDETAAARAAAESARDEAARGVARLRDGEARVRENETRTEAARRRLALLEERIRLEQLAARDTERRAEDARRSLLELEQTRARQRGLLDEARRKHAEIEQEHAALVERCGLLRAQETELRESIAELDTRLGCLTGARVAAEPRVAAPTGSLLLPDGLAPPREDVRPADWLGGLRGLDVRGARGQEFLQRLGPVLDRHPDGRALETWAREGRTVFVLCDTPDEAGRLKELIDVWGEVDPDGIAAIAPAFQSTTRIYPAPAPAARARGTARTRRRMRRRAQVRRGR